MTSAGNDEPAFDKCRAVLRPYLHVSTTAADGLGVTPARADECPEVQHQHVRPAGCGLAHGEVDRRDDGRHDRRAAPAGASHSSFPAPRVYVRISTPARRAYSAVHAVPQHVTVLPVPVRIGKPSLAPIEIIVTRGRSRFTWLVAARGHDTA